MIRIMSQLEMEINITVLNQGAVSVERCFLYV